MFSARMPTPGYLFLGSSESLMRLGTDFIMDEVGSAFVYVRPTPAGDEA
jgi:chemotaxis protein methyltransferase CheR